jgi:hypothetical protein
LRRNREGSEEGRRGFPQVIAVSKSLQKLRECVEISSGGVVVVVVVGI